jgi:hypothetical protein
MNGVRFLSSFCRPALSLVLMGGLTAPVSAMQLQAPPATPRDESRLPSAATTKGTAPTTPSQASPTSNDASEDPKPAVAMPNTPTPPTDPNAVSPKANPLSDQVPVAPPKPLTPAEEAAQKAKMAPSAQKQKESALAKLVSLDIMPASMQTSPTAPVTRAQLAEVLVKALKHNLDLYELFPFYRDVPRTHPDYAAIEVARETSLLTFQEDHGFYYPARPVRYRDLYVALAHALTGPNPVGEEQAHLLQPFGGAQAISFNVAPSVAKMARLRFFVTETGHVDPQLKLNELVTPDGLAPLVSSLMHIIELRSMAVEESEDERGSLLPGGLSLVISPSTAIFESQLTPGQRVFFSLSEAVTPLPKESRVRALVQDVSTAQHRYTLLVDEIRTPEDVFYRTQASLVITFPPRRRTNFIVPGQLLQTVTEALPIPTENKKSAIPPATAIPTPKPL